MDSWTQIPENLRQLTIPLPEPWEGLFGALRAGSADELIVIGQIGQSLDGRVATVTGHSHYINGSEGLAHLHRLRALVDAVVIGVGTALADDPLLTVRRVPGPNPARVVIDPKGRLPESAKLLARDGARRLIVTATAAPPRKLFDVESIKLPTEAGQIAPVAVLKALAERGLRRILIEGGPDTVSRFLGANCLDRLHVTVAPIVLGSGRMGLNLPPIERVDQALRVPMHVHRLGDEMLFDCDLSAQRIAVG